MHGHRKQQYPHCPGGSKDVVDDRNVEALVPIIHDVAEVEALVPIIHDVAEVEARVPILRAPPRDQNLDIQEGGSFPLLPHM